MMDTAPINQSEKIRLIELRNDPTATVMDEIGLIKRSQILLNIPANPQKFYATAAVADVIRGLVPAPKKCTPYNENSRMYSVREGCVHIEGTEAPFTSGSLTIFRTSNTDRVIDAENVLSICDSLPAKQKMVIGHDKLKKGSKHAFKFSTGVTFLDSDRADDYVDGKRSAQMNPGTIVMFVSSPFVAGVPVGGTSAADRDYNGPLANLWFSHSTDYFGYEQAPQKIDKIHAEREGTELSVQGVHAVPMPNVVVTAPAYGTLPEQAYSVSPFSMATPPEVQYAALNTALNASHDGEIIGHSGHAQLGQFRSSTLRRTLPLTFKAVDTGTMEGGFSFTKNSSGDPELWSVGSVLDGFLESAIGFVAGPLGEGIYLGITSLIGTTPGNMIDSLMDETFVYAPSGTPNVQVLNGTIQPRGGWPSLTDNSSAAGGGGWQCAAGWCDQQAGGAIWTAYASAYPVLAQTLNEMQGISTAPWKWFAAPVANLFAPNPVTSQPAMYPENPGDDCGRIGFWEERDRDGLELRPGFGQPTTVTAIRSDPRPTPLISSQLLGTGSSVACKIASGRFFLAVDSGHSGYPKMVHAPVFSSGTAHTVGANYANTDEFIHFFRFATPGQQWVAGAAVPHIHLQNVHITDFNLSTGVFSRSIPLSDLFWSGTAVDGSTWFNFHTSSSTSIASSTTYDIMKAPASGHVFMISFHYPRSPNPIGTYLTASRMSRAWSAKEMSLRRRLHALRTMSERTLPNDPLPEPFGSDSSSDDSYLGLEPLSDDEFHHSQLEARHLVDKLDDEYRHAQYPMTGARGPWDEDDCLCRKAFRCENHPSRNEFTGLVGLEVSAHKKFRKFLRRTVPGVCLHSFALNCPYLHDHAPKPKAEALLDDHVLIHNRAAIVAELNRLTAHFMPS